MRIFNDIIINEAAAEEDKTGEVVTLNFIQDLAFQIVWTSTTCAGTIKIQCSNDQETWIDLATHNQTVNNNNGAVMISISDANYAFIRIFFDYTSGSLTTLNVRLNGKGL